jgi:hypothetical protein
VDVIAAHLIAATLSAVAFMAKESWVFVTVRTLMPPLGFFVAWHAFDASDPAWMVGGLVLMGVMFLRWFTPGRSGWFVLNPLVTCAYLAHLAWMALAA